MDSTLTAGEIRQRFIDFFKRNEHTYVHSSYFKNYPLLSTPYSVKPESTGIQNVYNSAPTKLLAVISHCGEIIWYKFWEQGLNSQIASVNLISSTFYLCDPGQII